jgi:hypothetical protein
MEWVLWQKSLSQFLLLQMCGSRMILFVFNLPTDDKLKHLWHFFPRLKNATSAQLKKYRLIGLGTGIHWENLDEDLSVEGIVLGRPSASLLPTPKRSKN